MATFYVRKTGNNANPGTSVSAKLTITGSTGGLSLLSAGDTLVVGDGTYVEGIQPSTGSNPGFFIPGGSSGAPTILKAENRNLAIIRPGSGSYTFWINHDWITVDGIYMDAGGIAAGGALYCASQSHIVFKNGTAANGNGVLSSSSGILNDPQNISTDIQCINMDVLGNGFGADPNQDHGIYLHGASNVIDGCRIHDNSGYGIHLYHSSSLGGITSPVIRNNTIYSNGSSGILIDDSTNGLIYNNLVYSNGSGKPGIWVFGIAASTRIYNNTIYNNATWGVQIESGASGTLVKNNIIYLNPSGSITGTATTATNLAANPSFVGPLTPLASANFRLLSGSAADTSGTDLSSDFATLGVTSPSDFDSVTRTAPWDIGAFVFGGAPTFFFPTDDFDYTTTADLVTQNAGQGWSGAWARIGTGNMTIQVGPAGASGGGNAVRSTSTTGLTDYRRACNAVTTGIIRAYMRLSILNPSDYIGLYFTQAGNGLFSVEFSSAGNIDVFPGPVTLQTYAVDTWYLVEQQLDGVAQPGMFRVRINGGAWSSWITAFNSMTSVDGVGIEDLATNAHTFWLDAIGAPSTGISVTGVSGTGAVGTGSVVHAAANKTVTGVTGTAGLGTVTVQAGAAKAVTGVSGTGSVGTVTVTGSASKAVTGVAGTGSVGNPSITIDASVSIVPTGVSGTGSAGTPTVAAGATVIITGVSGTGSVGSVGISVGPKPTGVLGTGSVGTVTVSASARVAITGVSATGTVGSASVLVTDTGVTLTGVSAAGSVGSVSVMTTSVGENDPFAKFGELYQVVDNHTDEDFGILGPIYKETSVMRVEYRRRGAELSWQQPFEIPDRYTVYVRHFALARTLEREGPGQNLKLAAHYQERYEAGVQRMLRRKQAMDFQKTSVLGGRPPSPGGPPRARLPWRYGTIVR